MNDPIRNQHSNNILHQLETKDEDIVLGEQSVIVSKKKKHLAGQTVGTRVFISTLNSMWQMYNRQE